MSDLSPNSWVFRHASQPQPRSSRTLFDSWQHRGCLRHRNLQIPVSKRMHADRALIHVTKLSVGRAHPFFQISKMSRLAGFIGFYFKAKGCVSRFPSYLLYLQYPYVIAGLATLQLPLNPDAEFGINVCQFPYLDIPPRFYFQFLTLRRRLPFQKYAACQ